jgi:hypothetical protein
MLITVGLQEKNYHRIELKQIFKNGGTKGGKMEK